MVPRRRRLSETLRKCRRDIIKHCEPSRSVSAAPLAPRDTQRDPSTLKKEQRRTVSASFIFQSLTSIFQINSALSGLRGRIGTLGEPDRSARGTAETLREGSQYLIMSRRHVRTVSGRLRRLGIVPESPTPSYIFFMICRTNQL